MSCTVGGGLVIAMAVLVDPIFLSSMMTTS